MYLGVLQIHAAGKGLDVLGEVAVDLLPQHFIGVQSRDADGDFGEVEVIGRRRSEVLLSVGPETPVHHHGHTRGSRLGRAVPCQRSVQAGEVLLLHEVTFLELMSP